jgi:molybdopterin-guanine dinucleotide biosynthesis protein A
MSAPDDRYQDVTGVILAGGRSQRMGTDKALLEVDGIPLLERVGNVFRRLFRQTLLITNDPDLYAGLGFPVYTDIHPNRASLVGIYTGLLKAETPFIFCASCDMPFLNESLIRFLLDLRTDADWVLPFSENGQEPLHAVYGTPCVNAMEDLIAEDRLKIMGLFDRVRTRRVEPEEVAAIDPKFLSFLNCNTPEDLEAADALAREMR